MCGKSKVDFTGDVWFLDDKAYRDADRTLRVEGAAATDMGQYGREQQ